MRRLPLIALAPLTILAACGSTEETPTEAATPTETPTPDALGSTSLTLPGDKLAGSASLTGDGDTVSITINLTGLPDGVHAAHLQTTGSCDKADFPSAENPKGSHLGDLPNVTMASGRGSVTAALPGTREEVLAAIFDKDGTAVVVRADPAGNAGNRIACGVLTAS